MPEDGRPVGAAAHVPEVRPRRLLRQLEEPARHRALQATGHPVMRSIQPGESWKWCYVDKATVD